MTPEGISLDSIVICDYPYDQVAPSVTFGNGFYLACWADQRGEFSNIYCARILPNGTVLEKDGFPVHQDSISQMTPVSAFDGSNFLVVWAAYELNINSIYGVRISPGGSILDSTPIIISQGPDAKYAPAVSFDGSNYMVIWNDSRLNGTEYDQWAARVTPEGLLLDTNGIPVDTSKGYQFDPSITFLNPYYLAVWTDDGSGSPDIFGKRISPPGSLIDTAAIPICTVTGMQIGAAAFAGSEKFLVVWNDGRLGFENSDIYATFIDTAGQGVEEVSNFQFSISNEQLLVYPNPFKERVEIKWILGTGHSALGKNLITNDQCPMTISIYDVSGRLVKSVPLTTNHLSLGTDLKGGIYFLRIENLNSKEVLSRKLIKIE
ncbi:MAG: T9SS type A sorting domain-containing protein [Candidatus Cloacimonadota bacterium]|nr:MAG: T9SS type A sorting domain-containing protein [Candidatus Cloacimonadota bacterium]